MRVSTTSDPRIVETAPMSPDEQARLVAVAHETAARVLGRVPENAVEHAMGCLVTATTLLRWVGEYLEDDERPQVADIRLVARRAYDALLDGPRS